MPKKTSSTRHQKLYKMRGCSKKTRKNYLGGSVDVPLAYTGKPIHTVPNPFLAYTGKGGSSCQLSKPVEQPTNINAASPAYPNTGPVPRGDIFLNSTLPQHGGNCGCGVPFLSGGKTKKGGCGPMCAVPLMLGGAKHRKGCKCSDCKSKNGMKGGNPGIPYPDGLVGTPWTYKIASWPGVNGIPGDSNYYPVNNYQNDISRQMVDVGANPPFLYGGRKTRKNGSRSRKQKGGTLSNFMGQDFINLGRQFQYGIGSAYNALAGYTAPVNPLPWKDQLPNNTPIGSSPILKV